MTLLSAEQISFFRKNPDIASEILLETKLEWFQRIMLREAWEKPFTIWIASRGIGKTWVGAINLILVCILYNNIKAGVYAKEYNYTKATFEKIVDIYDKSRFLREITLKKPFIGKDESGIEFINHSNIVAEVAKRSKRKNIVLCDEAREMDLKVMYDTVIYPYLNACHPVIQNRSLMVSSATYENSQLHERVKLYQKYIKEGDPNYGYVSFDVNVALTGRWMDEIILANAKKLMMDDEYKIEYLNEFVSLSSGWIPSSLVRNAEIEYQPENKYDGQSIYFMAYDPAIAAGGDNATIVVCKIVPNEGVRIVRSIGVNGMPFPEQAMLIRKTVKDYHNVQQLDFDNEKLGIAMRQYLAQPSIDDRDNKTLPAILCKDDYSKDGLKLINPINFRDTNLIWNMAIKTRNGLQNGKLHLPKDTYKIYISHEDRKSLSEEEVEKIEMAEEIALLKKETTGIKCKTSDTGNAIQLVPANPRESRRDRFTSFFMCSSTALDFYESMQSDDDDGCVGFA